MKNSFTKDQKSLNSEKYQSSLLIMKNLRMENLYIIKDISIIKNKF
jgi:hypothetical protein